jgi:serine/threonine-protein phosphatase PGAM5
MTMQDYFVDGPRLEGAFRKYIHRAAGTETRQQYDILVAHGNIFRFFILK